MRKDHDLSKKAILAGEDNVTDSFPLMLIIALFFTSAVFQLLIFPLARDFAQKFAN